MKVRRALAVGGMAVAAVVALAVPAAAHVPVVLDSTDVVPWKAPLVLDGTDPIALLGALPCAGAVRSAQLRLAAGQPLIVGYGIPDLAPENTVATSALPQVLIVAPNGSVTVVRPTTRTPFHNPDFNQDYLFLGSYQATAIAGTYSLLVTGGAAERFFVATGVESEEFHGISRGTVASDEQVAAWYATAP
jgi:hypothetical protein